MEISPTEPDSARNWLELPGDVTMMILMKLCATDILNNVQKVCSSWRNICKHPFMWRSINLRSMGAWDIDFDFDKLCKHAVDRSCGQLAEISLEYLASDEILDYIADSSSNLRRLQLVSCYTISDEALIRTAEKLPLLEDLELSYCSFSIETLEDVGMFCPLLKSFKWNNMWCKRPQIECDEGAFTIATSMCGLHYLQLFGNKLTNEGVEAILNGCPHLESLDLRQCFNVTLGGNLWKRCSEQIKYLRSPTDSTEDYEYDVKIHDDSYDEFYDDGSFDDDYPSGLSDVDILSEDDAYYEFSGGSDFSDDGGFSYD